MHLLSMILIMTYNGGLILFMIGFMGLSYFLFGSHDSDGEMPINCCANACDWFASFISFLLNINDDLIGLIYINNETYEIQNKYYNNNQAAIFNQDKWYAFRFTQAQQPPPASQDINMEDILKMMCTVEGAN